MFHLLVQQTGNMKKLTKQTWKDRRLINSLAARSSDELSTLSPKRSALEMAVEPYEKKKNENEK